ncbi:MAG TPA: hypothetical protein VJN94_11395 [Candidatus Binataceae bacterium]|nr:hypothetical protein [Candidatus Binataceae bacterium]
MREHSLLAVVSMLVLGIGLALPRTAAAKSYCEESRLCADPTDGRLNHGYYVGHDEPSLLFYSNRAGSGNSSFYNVTLPVEPSLSADQGGVGSFRLYTALWFGMALCDSQSAPEFTHAECTPDSDGNIRNGSDPAKPDYAGRRPGGAYMELQFYPPATSGENPPSCDPGKWCAALNVDSFSADQTGATEVFNNFDCEGQVGDEPVNFAWVTRSGNPTVSNALVNTSFGPPVANSDVLRMNPGDQLAIGMLDTADGFQVSITDFSTGEQGTMTANAANGFEQVVFDPKATACTFKPYTFHPMFATSNENTRIWTAHTYNVGFAMEIGHQDESGYVNGSDGDSSFSGPSYQHDWAGSSPPASDSQLHASSIAFPSPLFAPSSGGGSGQYDRVAFEADMPVFEFDDQGCVTKTGAGCTNPPTGAQFYPIYSSANINFLSCVWHFGDTQIAGTTNLYGGDSVAEYGSLLQEFYPGLGFRDENYRQVLNNNPCEFTPFIPPNVRTIPQPIPPEEIVGEILIIEEEITLVTEGVPIGQAIRVGEVLNSFLFASILQTEFGTGAAGGGTGAIGGGANGAVTSASP